MLSDFFKTKNLSIFVGVGTVFVLLAALTSYFIFFAPNEDGFRLNKVTDETRELFSRKNTNTKTLGEEALAARAEFFSEKAGNASRKDPNKLSTEQLELAMNQLLAATKEVKKPTKKRLDPAEMASLKALDLSGQTPRVRRSSEGKLLSVSGNFDLASFSSDGSASPIENAVSNFLASHPKTFGLSPSVSLISADKPKTGVSGDQIVRLEKSLDGLPVWGEQIVVSVLGSEVRSITGALRESPLNIDTNASLEKAELLQITEEHLKSNRDSFQITSYERGIIRYAKRYSYTYKVKVYVSPSEGWELYISPIGKRVVLKVPTIFTQLTSSSGTDLLGSQVAFNSTKSSDGNFIMLDDSFPISSKTQIAESAFDEDGERFLPYVSSSDPNSGWNAAGVSAMKNTKIIYDYFLTKHNRNSYDDKGSPLVSIVDYQSTEGECFNNAFWNGSQMTYGDGCLTSRGTGFGNLAASLDVAAHEVAHGVVQFSANLRYENQSGALNESFADIFGVSIDSEDWVLGEDIMASGRFLRSISNPASGRRPQPAHLDDFVFLPNTKEGDWGGVHINSGIQNRAFYLLVEGNEKEGKGLSIGRADAETIIYAALLKLTPNSEYADSANQWATEAELIFGGNSRQVTAVEQAWANVGIEISKGEEAEAPANSEDGAENAEDDSSSEGTNERDIPLPPGDDVVVYLVAQDGSTGSGDDPAREQYDLMLYNAAQETDGFVAEANLGPFNDFPAAYIRPAVATLPSERTLLLYVRDSTRKLYFTYSDELEEEDTILDFGEDITIKSVAVARDGSRIAVVIEQAQFVIYVIDLVKEEVSTHQIREPNYIPDDPGTAVDLVDSINFDPQGTSLIFDYRVCREEIDSDTCTELWSVGLVKVSSGSIEFPFLEFQDPLIDIANPRYSQKTYEAIVLDIVDFSNYEAEEKAATAVAILTSEGTTGVINPNQSEDFDRAYGYPSFVGDDEAVLVQARFDDSIFLYSVAINENYEAENSATNVIPFSAALSAAHVNVFVNTRTVLGLKEENIELGSVEQGKQLTGSFTLGNFSNSDISITNVTPSSDEISTELGNTRLLPGEQKAFSFSVKTNNLSGGDYSGSISIEHDADNPPIEVQFSASIEGTNVLEAPKNLVATDGTDSEAILLSWSSVQGAQEYRVYWADEPESRKKRLVTVSTAPSSSNPFRHEAGNTNTYYYWVTALGSESESALSDADTGFIGEGGTSSGDTGNSSDDNPGSSDSKITFGGKEYRWIKERKTQTAAQAHAESLGGHLAVINSAAEDDFVYSMVRGASLSGLGTAGDGGGVSYVWLGGNDASSENNWVWVNGDPFTYTNWGRAEPDNYLNQDGLAMGLENWPAGRSGSSAFGLAGEWNDIDRGNELTFIVELPLESENETGGSGSDQDQNNDESESGSDSNSGPSPNTLADFQLPYSFAQGPFGGCAIDDLGLECWGTSWISRESTIPIVSNPRQVAVGRVHACVLDDSGVSCWGVNDERGQTEVPSLSRPSYIVSGRDVSCALDAIGVKCWGDNAEGKTDVPELQNPREVGLGYHNACAIDDTGVVCWGDESSSLATTIPEMINPSNLSMGDQQACVLDNGRAVCWGNGYGPTNESNTFYKQPALLNPRVIVAGGSHVCAIDDQDLKCWGEERDKQLEDIPPVSNPSRLFRASRDGMCVLDDSGMQCWGGDVESNTAEALSEIPSTLSFALASKRVVTQYLQTTSASQNISTLDVINTSERSQTFRGILRGGSGEKVGLDQPVLGSNVPSMGRLSLTSSDLEDIFEIAPWSGPAMLTIQGDSTFDLMSKLESPSGLVSNTNCVRDNRVLNLEGFDSDNLSYVRLINTGANTTGAVTGTLYAADGSVVGTANTRLVPKLDPYQQTWVSRDRLSSLIGAEWNGEGMLEVNPVPGLKLLNLNFVTDESTFFNFSCADKATLLAEPSSSSDPANIARMYLQTTSTSANVSLTHLVNTSDSPQRYIGTLYGSDGVQVGSADQPLHSGTVPAKGRLIISSTDIESAFNISPWRGPAILEVKGDGLFELMTKLESPSGLISNTNCVRTEQVHNVGGFDQTDVSYVRFINVGDTDLTNIRGTLFDDNGNAVGSADQVLVDFLPAKSHVWRNRSQLSTAIGARWNGTASLRITSAPEDLRLLNLNYINSETFFNFSCYQSGR